MFGMKKEAAPPGSAEAEAPAGPQYITRAEVEAMINAVIDTQAIVNSELATGCRDQFFSSGALQGRLEGVAKRGGFPDAIARCLARMADGMAGRSVKDYGVDRSVRRARSSHPSVYVLPA